jgi:alcohol dehydrogenase class IV
MTIHILPTPEVHLGQGVHLLATEYLKRYGATEILLILDPGLYSLNLHQDLLSKLEDSGLRVEIFTKVLQDPDINSMDNAVAFARSKKPDAVIAMGGGSTIDTAKVVASLAVGSQTVSSVIGIEILQSKGLPLIAVPTTAGTGSEVTPIAVVSDPNSVIKKAVVSRFLIPDLALLDPLLLVGLPERIKAHTGIDALSHAVESFTSLNASNYSEVLSLEAIRIISNALPLVYRERNNLGCLEAMLKGSLLAGLAFANAGVAAAHAFAYPLGAEFHLPHGLAVGLMLMPVSVFNLSVEPDKFARMAVAMTGRVDSKPEEFILALKNLMGNLQLPISLKEIGVPSASLSEMAGKSMEVTRLLNNNPRPIQFEDANRLFLNAYDGPEF